MNLLMVYRKPFAALEEGLMVNGCKLTTLAPKAKWSSYDLEGIDACLMDFCDVAKRPLWTNRLRNALNKRKAPAIGINRDAPWYKGVRPHRLKLFSMLSGVNIYASHSLQPGLRYAPETVYLPNAAWLGCYNLTGRSLEELREPGHYQYQVSFLGNVDAEAYPEHRPRVERLNQLAGKLSSHGIELTLHHSIDMSVEQQVDVIQRSRINLNIGSAADITGERTWGPAERLYGIPACGGFVLTDERRHASDDFEPGTELVQYADLDDCVSKIRHHLDHFDETRNIAEAAYHRVMHHHTYAHRAGTLVESIEDWKRRHG